MNTQRPLFPHTLSFDEQRKLTEEQLAEYFEFLMGRPLRRKVSEQEYLQGDYSKIGSMQATEWGQ